MTIKEACIKVLTESGGRAPLKILCMKVQELVVFKGATPYNSICTELLTHPKDFRRTEGKKGWWELTSFQEEMAELKQQVAELTEINKQIMAIPKEADFIEKFLQEVMNDYNFFTVVKDDVHPEGCGTTIWLHFNVDGIILGRDI